jgi:HEAT repeat protein
VRTAVAAALANWSRPEALPLLRELVKDRDRDVRTAAMKALTCLTKTLASFAQAGALPLLRELAKDWNREVRTASSGRANKV